MHEDNAPQNARRGEAAARDAAWETAFLAQLTDALADSVGAFAKKRASWLEGKTKRKDGYVWRELLQDALTDTWLGDVTWDPTKAPLDLHLKRVIRSRTTMVMKHLTKFPRVAVHSPRLELEHEISSGIERNAEHANDLEEIVECVVGTLFMLAADDQEVLRILDCFADGVVDRREVVRASGMTQTTYHNARRRLMALVEKLPQHLKNEAVRAMA